MSFQNILKRGSKKSNSPSDTKAFGFSLGEALKNSAIVALRGDLGAGKTTLIKGLALGYAGIPEDEVQSPTFTLCHTYEAEKKIHHFDLYRLKSSEEFQNRGFEDILYSNDLVLIEWSERIEPILPPNTIHITLTPLDQNCRTIEVS